MSDLAVTTDEWCATELWFTGMSQKQVADELGMTQVRVSALVRSALRKTVGRPMHRNGVLRQRHRVRYLPQWQEAVAA